MFSIAVVEDDPDIRQELKALLTNALYHVEIIESFENIEGQILDSGADLILLDINLPGTDGMAVLRKVREQIETPVIFVTGRGDSMDELNGMLMGADDYVVKPYHAPVLLAHIAAVLKRIGKTEGEGRQERLTCGACRLNLLNSTLTCRDKTAELTRNELRICYFLFSHKGQIVSRADLIDDLWENQIFIDDNTLSVNITRIRCKLRELGAENLIETKRGQGYLCRD